MKKSLLLVFLFLRSMDSLYACQCAAPSIFRSIGYSDNIFTGTAIKLTVRGYNNFYLFSIQQKFKGLMADTIEISARSGGGDCGTSFEIGKQYLVYSHNHETTQCMFNLHIENAAGSIEKLKYLQSMNFFKEAGLDTDPVLSDSEEAFLNFILNKKENLKGKKMAFFRSKYAIDKRIYFNDWKLLDQFPQIVYLNDEERSLTGGYDLILVTDRARIRKHTLVTKPVSRHFKRKLIRQLQNQHQLNSFER